jgi:hypothetical protein
LLINIEMIEASIQLKIQIYQYIFPLGPEFLIQNIDLEV